MAEFPALPFWTDAYLSDTRDLTAAQHGAYLLLLMTAWRTKENGLPDDDEKLARWACMDRRTWLKNKTTIMAFWRKIDGLWHQKRLDDERKRAEHVRDSQVKAGLASALKRKKMRSTRDTTEQPTALQPPSTSPSTISSKEDNTPLPPKENKPSNEDKKSITSYDLIKSFDNAIIKAYGKNYERLCPTSTDKLEAEDWLKRGITVEFCDDWLTKQMSAMKERGRNCPTNLRFFSSSICQAFASNTSTNPYKGLTEQEKREKAYREHGRWLTIWGPFPEHLKGVLNG